MDSVSGHPVLSLIVLVLASGAFSGCNSGNQPPGSGSALEADQECYQFVQGRDTINLTIVETDGKVKGRLAFRFFEKDKSSGTLEGVMRGDTLFANYAFTSEGTLSNREVAFRKVGSEFRMGSGEILNSGSTDVLRDPATLEFSETVVLKNMDCDSLSQSSIR
jgi:hypothetical protein